MSNQVTVLDRPETPTVDIDALLESRQEPGRFVPKTIETLQQTLGELVDELDPQDETRPLNQGSIRYVDGKAAFSFRNEDGSWSTPMSMTKRAYRQAGTKILGAGGLQFVENQRKTDATGEKMATINWMERLQHAEKRGLFRSMQFPGERFRTIRGVLSGSSRGFMTNLDNLDVVGLLAGSAAFANLPLISWTVTPDSMRIRGLLDPSDGEGFDASGNLSNPGNSHNTLLRIPVPMFEIGNGEVGNASFSFTAGTYTFACLNGMGSWGDDAFTQRWTHTGGDDRGEKIQAAFGDAVKSARVSSRGLVDDFKQSTTVAVDDAFALLDQWGRKVGKLTAAQTRRAADAVRDETSYPGRNLAAVISGITLAAQSEGDLDSQREMERFASYLMRKGLRAGGVRGRIELPEA